MAHKNRTIYEFNEDPSLDHIRNSNDHSVSDLLNAPDDACLDEIYKCKRIEAFLQEGTLENE